jgi:hypothetical protein
MRKQKTREYHKEYYLKNKIRIKERIAAYAKTHPAQVAERARSWVKRNRSRVRQLQERWRKNNLWKMVVKTTERESAKIKATPKWANPGAIKEIYRLASLRTKNLGQEFHVDHIVPLRHPKVCGLHVESNLRIVPKDINLQKSNRHWPEMPT